MLVFEVRVKMRVLQPVPYQEASTKITYFVDSALILDPDFQKLHSSREYKGYCMDLPYPIEKGRTYLPGKVYTIRVRTVRQDLAEYFSARLACHKTQEWEGIGTEIRIVSRRPIAKVYTVTPTVIKTEQGYWRDHMTLEAYEERLKVNLLKKYRQFTGKTLDENFELFQLIEFKNAGPIKIPQKGITLLGDKLDLIIAPNLSAQELAYLALGAGIGEMGARSCGFLNYQYM